MSPTFERQQRRYRKSPLIVKMVAEIPEKPGIYCVTNNVIGKRYVGQSVNIRRRIMGHLRRMDYLEQTGRDWVFGMLINEHGKRHEYSLKRIPKLYLDCEVFGLQSFSVMVLELLPAHMTPGFLNEMEQRWINRFVESDQPIYNVVTNIPGAR